LLTSIIKKLISQLNQEDRSILLGLNPDIKTKVLPLPSSSGKPYVIKDDILNVFRN
jgi:hypothetical protein